MMASFAVPKLFRFPGSHLLVTSLCVCASVPVRKVLLVPVSSRLFLLLFLQIQDSWSYVEVLDPFVVEFCAG